MTSGIRVTLLIVAIAVLPLFGQAPRAIRVENGLVAGTAGSHGNVRVFKGIPFAAPPVGELRWKRPRPVSNWEGVRPADAFSPKCMQRSAERGTWPDPAWGGDRSTLRMSEDCLYLNVYAAARTKSTGQPVMVWFHGGGFGSGTAAIYDGEALAQKGVVVVTANYRLNVFGFLGHPELSAESDRRVSGNYGILDQIAALQWVQRNIAAFGGDPRRVTIFGESAGSWSVNYLMASPLARGLFQGAIGESGAQFAPRAGDTATTRPLSEVEQAGLKFGKAAGAPTLAALRAMDAAQLEPAARNAGFGWDREPTGVPIWVGVDGWVLPDDVPTIFAKGQQNDVPLIVGSNADEGSGLVPSTLTRDRFLDGAKRRFGSNLESFLRAYPATSDADAVSAEMARMRDERFGWEGRTWARMQTRKGKSKAYLYYFSRTPPGRNVSGWVGAVHGVEIPYVFNWVNSPQGPVLPWHDVDRSLARQVSEYWVNLASKGDPNGRGLVTWPPYEPAADLAMHLGDTVRVGPVPHKAALDFFDSFFAASGHSLTAHVNNAP